MERLIIPHPLDGMGIISVAYAIILAPIKFGVGHEVSDTSIIRVISK